MIEKMQTFLGKLKGKEEVSENKNDNTQMLIEKMKEKTAMPAYKIEIRKDGYQPGIFESKFGGIPYWDLKKEYPVDSFGEKMMLLAQINFTQARLENECLPKQGMLQFFIAANDDVYGMDFDTPDSQSNFRVVYHENIDETVTKELVLALGIPVCTDENLEYPPITGEFAISLHKTIAYMGTEVCDFDKTFGEVAKTVLGSDMMEQSAYNFLGSDAFEEVCDELNNGGHWMLGYPYFTQYDPRDNSEYYDTLLLQIDSEMGEGTDYVMWGDCGVANFFMNSEALKNRDFSKVLYNWDCC